MDEIEERLLNWGRAWRARQELEIAVSTNVHTERQVARGSGLRALMTTTFAAGVLISAIVLGVGRQDLGDRAGSHPTVVRVGDGVEATGQLMFRPGASPVLCGEVLANEAGLACSAASVEVAELDASTVPGYAPERVWASGFLVIRGTWGGDNVGKATFARPTVPRVNDRPLPPCVAPAGGWALATDGSPSGATTDQLGKFVAAHSDLYAEPWLARAEHGATVMVVGTVGDTQQAQDQLSAAYTGNLCVVSVAFSEDRLRHDLAALNLPDSVSAHVDPILDRVVVRAVAFTQSLADAIGPLSETIYVDALVQSVGG